MSLILLNTTSMTSDGKYRKTTISQSDALEVVEVYDTDEITSYVGHLSVARIMSELLGITVAVSSDEYKHVREDVCLCFKLNSHAEEGKTYTRAEIEKVGFTFELVSYL